MCIVKYEYYFCRCERMVFVDSDARSEVGGLLLYFFSSVVVMIDDGGDVVGAPLHP